MKSIPLTQGQYAIVDDEDYNELSKHKWSAQWDPKIKSFYAVRHSNRNFITHKQIAIFMHRMIMGLEYGDKRQVDHIDHATLNNLRWNLRVVTHRQNHENRKDQSKHGAGIYRVNRMKNPYQLLLRIDGKRCHAGLFTTVEEAIVTRTEILESLTG